MAMDNGYYTAGAANDSADDNVIQPFQLEVSSLRGRAVRLGSVLNDVLELHAYPEPVAHLVAETMALALLLSSMLKYDGIFTLQAQGNGAVKMLVADVTYGGVVRGCASFDPDGLQDIEKPDAKLKKFDGLHNDLARYLGEGYIAFTVDQGRGVDRYQGIVELKGSSLVECVQHYFDQSEQIGTSIRLSVGRRDDKWRAGAIMLQHLPESAAVLDEMKAQEREEQQDDWRRASVLLNTCKEDELLSPVLHSSELLMRLFHEEGVRVYEPVAVTKGCRCSTERVESILIGMSEEDLRDMQDDKGDISMKCEFCSTEFVFALEDIRSKITQGDGESL